MRTEEKADLKFEIFTYLVILAVEIESGTLPWKKNNMYYYLPETSFIKKLNKHAIHSTLLVLFRQSLKKT